MEFDYIIIGGGASGCVLAARLAAESDASILLLERGREDKNRWIHIPATFFKALQSQDAETIISEPDPSLNHAPFAVPQGRVLGGGSSVNGMIYMRGQQQDYNDWADVHGCTGWSYADVLPTFKQQEANTRIHNEFHGSTGKLKVADPSAPHPVSQAIIEAAITAGIPQTNDFNGAQQQGAGWYQVMAHNGQRQSTAHCFLRPELARENLTVITSHTACRIQINNRRATAIEMRNNYGGESVIRARREIILCAGSFQSPKLLMLSGIGPKDELLRYGINVVHDSPQVGRNYQDHVGCPVTYRLKDACGLHGADKGLQAVKHGFDYFVLRRGLLTSNLLQSGACVDTANTGRPDVQYNFAPFAPGAPGTPPLGYHALQVHPMTMRPKSRGRLGLHSTNPSAAPKFESAMLSHPDDLDTLRRGIRLAQDIATQDALKDILAEQVWPGKSIDASTNSAELDDAIRAQARTIYHPAGTCRMGAAATDVVDSKLRVNGIENLRVADCSIMPALVSGNTNAPTMMIAGRAADLILAGH